MTSPGRKQTCKQFFGLLLTVLRPTRLQMHAVMWVSTCASLYSSNCLQCMRQAVIPATVRLQNCSSCATPSKAPCKAKLRPRVARLHIPFLLHNSLKSLYLDAAQVALNARKSTSYRPAGAPNQAHADSSNADMWCSVC